MLEPRTIALMALGAMASGCASEARSCDLDTDAIVMRATVNDLGDRVEVEVEFESGGVEGAALTLCPDRDRLEVNGVEASMLRVLGHVYYVVEFADAAVRDYEIALQRSDAQSVSVVVELPPIIEVLTPAPDSSHSRAAPLEVSWEPAWPEGSLALAVEDAVGSDCLEELGVSYEVEDTGSYTLSAHSLVSGSGGSCELTLALTRSVAVEYPATLHEGGQIAGFVRRRQPFTSLD
ncbi:MAG: hypothetical protein R6X02_00600 [Enhygromyxa sp.]